MPRVEDGVPHSARDVRDKSGRQNELFSFAVLGVDAMTSVTPPPSSPSWTFKAYRMTIPRTRTMEVRSISGSNLSDWLDRESSSNIASTIAILRRRASTGASCFFAKKALTAVGAPQLIDYPQYQPLYRWNATQPLCFIVTRPSGWVSFFLSKIVFTEGEPYCRSLGSTEESQKNKM